MIVLAIALVAALGGLGWQIQVERAALVSRFAAEREAAVAEAGRRLADSFGDVRDNLRLAGELVSQPGDVTQHERELRAFLEAVPQFKTMAIVRDGRERLVVTDRRAPEVIKSGTFLSDLVDAGQKALAAGPGHVITSPVMRSDDSGWLRVFAAANRSEHGLSAVAVLVDTEPFFAPLQLAAATPGGRLLVVGPHGGVTVATDKKLAELLEERASAAATSGLNDVLRRMQSEQGVMTLSAEASARLGVDGEAFIVFRPVSTAQMAQWGVAAVFPTEPLEKTENALFVRFSIAAALVTIFVSVLAGYLVLGHRRNAALRETRAKAEHLSRLHGRTQKILDGMPTMVAALSAGGRVVSFNRSLLENEPSMQPGRTLSEALPRASQESVAQLTSLIDAATRSGEPRSTVTTDLVLFDEPGTYSLHAVPLEHGTDELSSLIVIDDVSELRELETQLLRAEKLATVGVLAAGIAHEIGTPLGIVRGRAEYMQTKQSATDAQSEGLSIIVSQIDRVTRTLQQLLDFAQLRPAAVRSTALRDVVAAGSALLAVEAQRQKLHLTTDIPDGLPALAADPDQLQQVLLNLVLNAAQACRPGGHIRVAADRSPVFEGHVRVTVSDDGCGIPRELLHRVFDPFFTTKKRGQGTGLGLTMVAQIVRNHGGRVELLSEEGKGTQVIVDWPCSSQGMTAHA